MAAICFNWEKSSIDFSSLFCSYLLVNELSLFRLWTIFLIFIELSNAPTRMVWHALKALIVTPPFFSIVFSSSYVTQKTALEHHNATGERNRLLNRPCSARFSLRKCWRTHPKSYSDPKIASLDKPLSTVFLLLTLTLTSTTKLHFSISRYRQFSHS